jgi:hypothetical protein
MGFHETRHTTKQRISVRNFPFIDACPQNILTDPLLAGRFISEAGSA